MKEIKIEGFNTNTTPTDKPTVSVYGEEGSGKTRFACTAPDPIGLIPIDRKSRRTFDDIKKKMKKYVIAPAEKEYLKPKDSIKLALLDSENKEQLKTIRDTYTEVVKRVMDDAMKLAEHPDIQTIVVDSNSQLWDWILFSHFGRRNQIETFQRGAPNNDMVDFISALKHKNLVLLHRATEVWKDTGEKDKWGKSKQGPSGRFKAEGCSKLGYLITCELEMVTVPKAESLATKFQIRVRECQNNPLIEGNTLTDDWGVCGENVTWDNVMHAIKWIE